MIKAKCNRITGKVKIKGKVTEILTELTIIVDDVFEQISVNEMDYDTFKTVFIGTLNNIKKFKGGVKSDSENKTAD